MTKGTPSLGKHQKRTHIRCRRCGKATFHARDKECASCGFGKTSKKRNYSWANKKDGARKL